MLGPDGSGKSTIVKVLKEQLDFELCYLGYGANRSYYFSNILDKLGCDIFSRVLYRTIVTLDDFFKGFSYITFNKVGAIIDRYPCDNIVNTILDSRKSVKFHKLIFHFYPKPDVFILLVGEPNTLYERKKEISALRIEKYIETYKKVLNTYNVKYFEVDTTKLSLSECTNLITEKLNEI